MWPFTDTGATRADALSLWRETNGLLRELVEAIKGSESLTPQSTWTPRSSAPRTSSTLRTGTSRKLSDRDVTRNTRESLHALQQEAEAKRIHPHREAAAAHIPKASSSPETSGALPPVDPGVVELNQTTLAQLTGPQPVRQPPTFPLTAPIQYSDPSASDAPDSRLLDPN